MYEVGSASRSVIRDRARARQTEVQKEFKIKLVVHTILHNSRAFEMCIYIYQIGRSYSEIGVNFCI